VFLVFFKISALRVINNNRKLTLGVFSISINGGKGAGKEGFIDRCCHNLISCAAQLFKFFIVASFPG
jgi:hypothetical protein